MKTTIEIAPGLLQDTQLIKDITANLASHWVIIADQRIASHYAHPLQAALHCDLLTITADEAHKTREQKQIIEDQLFELGCNRDTGLIAIGGGITLDIVGFVAATFARGIPVIYIPTTLLAMVDATVGGKTGVNTPFGKNLIGSFYLPHAVLIDPQTLATLPTKFFYDGMAEVIKHALISDKHLVEFLEHHADKILALDSTLLTDLIKKNIAIKSNIVAQDMYDKNIRHLLNAGHTIAHGVETASDYAFSHGEAVSLGLLTELLIAVELGICDIQLFERTKKILQRYHLPTTIDLPVENIIEALHYDKKNKHDKVYCALLQNCGQPYVKDQQYSHPVELTVIKHALIQMQTAKKPSIERTVQELIS